MFNLNVCYIRLRNPWGQPGSYNGRWSPNSNEWKKVSDNAKAEIDFNKDAEGDFFMSFEDFSKEFEDIDFVHVNLNAFYTNHGDYNNNFKWINKNFNGAWVKNKNAGGKLNLQKLE